MKASSLEILNNTIFRADENIGFKGAVEEYKPRVFQPSAQEIPQFFCINPIISYSNLKYENISSFRNFLIEFDSARLSTQERWVKNAGLPYSLKTFSGNKSFHYIVSLTEGVSLEEYRKLASLLIKYVFHNKADWSCANPNRLSRTPGAIRIDTGKEQLLSEQSPAISHEQLMDWLNVAHKNCIISYEVNQHVEQEKKQRAISYVNQGNQHDTEGLLKIFFPEWRQVLTSTKIAEGKRHSIAVSSAIKLYQCGVDPALMMEYITEFLELNGKGALAWQEAGNVVNWVCKRVTPLSFEEVVE